MPVRLRALGRWLASDPRQLIPIGARDPSTLAPVRAGCAGWRSSRGPVLLVGMALASALTLSLGSCSSGNARGSAQADQDFLSAVHVAAPDIGAYRTDIQLARLGHAACDGFRSGASYQQLADRLVLLEGNNPLPSADLGAVIDSAVTAFCPQFHDRVT
jgi:hypothetical protein